MSPRVSSASPRSSRCTRFSRSERFLDVFSGWRYHDYGVPLNQPARSGWGLLVHATGRYPPSLTGETDRTSSVATCFAVPTIPASQGDLLAFRPGWLQRRLRRRISPRPRFRCGRQGSLHRWHVQHCSEKRRRSWP